MKSLLLGAWLAPIGVLAQTAPADGWGILAAYGAAAPFALLCLWVMRKKDEEISILRTELGQVTHAGMEQVVPALVRSTDTVAEAVQALQRAEVFMHSLAGRGLDPDSLKRFVRLLRDLERRLDEEP